MAVTDGDCEQDQEAETSLIMPLHDMVEQSENDEVASKKEYEFLGEGGNCGVAATAIDGDEIVGKAESKADTFKGDTEEKASEIGKTDALAKQEGQADVENLESTPQETKPNRRFGHRIVSFRNKLSERRAAAVSASLASEASATQAAKEEKEKQPVNAVDKELEKFQDSDLESMRASQISVTVVKEETESYGFALRPAVKDKKECVEVDLLVEEGLLQQSPLQVGDVLRTVNNKRVTDCDKVMEDLVGMEGPVTLVVETPQGNPSIVQAFCRKPSKESKVGIGFHILEHGGHNLLQINHLDSNGLLSHSALSQGDLVLAINGVPCAEKSPEEAAALILESTSTVTIIALNPKLASRQNGGIGSRAQRWMRGAKRAGIAIGGGTMVGVGLIFIPTLPPPFGEVLIVGGVSVLGTEFEAPKRLVKSTRDTLERAVGRSEAANDEVGETSASASNAQPESSEVETNAAATAIDDCWSESNVESENDDEALAAAVASTLPNTGDEGSTKPKRNMKDKMKSFGRNYVLPFLDQVVGDRKDTESIVQPVPLEENAASLNPNNVPDDEAIPSPTSPLGSNEADLPASRREERSEIESLDDDAQNLPNLPITAEPAVLDENEAGLIGDSKTSQSVEGQIEEEQAKQDSVDPPMLSAEPSAATT